MTASPIARTATGTIRAVAMLALLGLAVVLTGIVIDRIRKAI